MIERAPGQPSARRKPLAARILLGAVLVGGLGALFWKLSQAGYDWRSVLEGTDPWAFFVAMATLPVFGFPISVCYFYAGMAFGPWTALACCLGALAINMSASYWMTHSIFRGPAQRLLARRGWRIPELSEENALRFVFLVRTVPGPPFFFQNLALGLSGIPFFTYLWISLLAQGSIAAGVIYCSGVLSRDPSSAGAYVVVAILAALLVVKTVKWVSKRRVRA